MDVKFFVLEQNRNVNMCGCNKGSVFFYLFILFYVKNSISSIIIIMALLNSFSECSFISKLILS